MIRLDNKYLAYEIFHRLKAGESKLEDLIHTYGKGPEKLQGGNFRLQSIDSVPKSLVSALSALKVGDYLKPVPDNKDFAIFQLREIQQSKFNEDAKVSLIKFIFDNWLDSSSVSLSQTLKNTASL